LGQARRLSSGSWTLKDALIVILGLKDLTPELVDSIDRTIEQTSYNCRSQRRKFAESRA